MILHRGIISSPRVHLTTPPIGAFRPLLVASHLRDYEEESFLKAYQKMHRYWCFSLSLVFWLVRVKLVNDKITIVQQEDSARKWGSSLRYTWVSGSNTTDFRKTTDSNADIKVWFIRVILRPQVSQFCMFDTGRFSSGPDNPYCSKIPLHINVIPFRPVALQILLSQLFVLGIIASAFSPVAEQSSKSSRSRVSSRKSYKCV